MDDYNQTAKNDFLYERFRYLGKFTPQNYLFNANLQEFSQRVSYLCNLQTLGKISSQDCYEEIELLWQQLTQSFKALGIERKDVNE
ncbi:hypothetical protein HCG51_08765 [Tolypothrix sp. PCC 7910]|uniref:DUF7219 family protein n=1 Tax=Tolypothrix sp. PCC 7910 TaxID=2099387 RepID=UPI0014278B61|nr:hypothetical protein [Tolypothrix sp. PCC 7910]QIR36822.1 hypothetical protein HCG51_08765 [Tolypothrix sp. PCC 7910]